MACLIREVGKAKEHAAEHLTDFLRPEVIEVISDRLSQAYVRTDQQPPPKGVLTRGPKSLGGASGCSILTQILFSRHWLSTILAGFRRRA